MNEYEIKLNHCVAILNTFPKDNKSLTIHVEDYFLNLNIKESDKLFIVDVFAETIKYFKVLKIVINLYYEQSRESIFEKDRYLYMVILFLIVFRMDSLYIEGLRRYVGKDRRLWKFLSFITAKECSWPFIEECWNRMYEHSFVCDILMAGVTKWISSISDLSTDITEIDRGHKDKNYVSLTTKPEPFKLTQTKPKRVPMPNLIPLMEKPKDIPPSTYIQPDELKKLNKKDARVLLEEAERLKPSCADKGMSKKTIEKMNQIVLDRNKELKFEGVKARPNPKINVENSTTKLNTATILREWKLYETLQKKKINELKKLEEGTFNSSQFQEWQQSVRAADLAEKIALLEKRRLEGKISYEEAILSRDNLIQENKAIVESLKRETGKRMEKFMKEKAIMEEQAKLQVEKIMASEEGAKDAKISVQNKNKIIAREIAAESKRLQEAALIEAEAEMRRRIDIIAEIRALEGSQSNNQKLIDHTQVAGYGLLCEMSLVELKERLSLCKKKNEETLNFKKENIQDNKQQKEKQLTNTLELIELCRAKLKERDVDEKTDQTVDMLNPEQVRELELLKINLEIKRTQRQNNQGKYKIQSSSSRNNNIRKLTQTEENKFDKSSENIRSKTAEKLAHMLSV